MNAASLSRNFGSCL